MYYLLPDTRSRGPLLGTAVQSKANSSAINVCWSQRVVHVMLCPHEKKKKKMQTLETSSNIMRLSATPPPTVEPINKHKAEWSPFWQRLQKLKINKLHKIQFMAELLNWIALDCTGVPDEVLGESIYLCFFVMLFFSFFFIAYITCR